MKKFDVDYYENNHFKDYKRWIRFKELNEKYEANQDEILEYANLYNEFVNPIINRNKEKSQRRNDKKRNYTRKANAAPMREENE